MEDVMTLMNAIETCFIVECMAHVKTQRGLSLANAPLALLSLLMVHVKISMNAG